MVPPQSPTMVCRQEGALSNTKRTMKNRTESSKRKRLIEGIKAKQRNTIWPDTLINSQGVNEFLWKGSPDAPLVQRIAAWIFGVVFILIGVGWLAGAYQKQWWGIGLLSIVWFFIGGKVFLNGFRWRKARASKGK
jgi:hypothetical protein